MPGQQSPLRNPFRANRVGHATFTIGTEASNVITVAVQLQDERRRDVAQRCEVGWRILQDANGDAYVTTAPDGGVAAGTDGAVLTTVTGKAGLAVSEADGDIDIAITHAAGAKTVYLGIVLPDGSLVISTAITFA